jgi:hypothetical protein
MSDTHDLKKLYTNETILDRVKIVTPITIADIANIMTTALEGGINY